MFEKICPECGSINNNEQRFCAECGAKLDEPSCTTAPIEQPTGLVGMHTISHTMGKVVEHDESLRMLAEYCTKRCATVGGDGYTEWVLNRNKEGELQLDYYSNYVGYENEIHKTTSISQDTWDKILEIKKKHHINKSTDERMAMTCGGYCLVKICIDGEAIRIINGGISEEEKQAYTQIKDLLTII